MGGAVKAVGNMVSSITGGGDRSAPVIVQAPAAAAPNAAPTLSADVGTGGGIGAGQRGDRKAAGVGANMLTGNLGDSSSNQTATKKLLGS